MGYKGRLVILGAAAALVVLLGGAWLLLRDDGPESPTSGSRGSQIAFVQSPGPAAGRETQIYIIDADGSGLRRLTRDPQGESIPVWSPDGKRLVFQRGDSLYVSNSNGSDERRLWDATGPTNLPQWLPDASRIVVSVDLLTGSEVLVINVDDSNVT